MVSYDTKDMYKEFGMDGHVGFGEKPALIVVDFSKGFTDQNSPLGNDYSMQIEAINRILAVMRGKNLPIIFSSEGYQSNMLDAGIWHRKLKNLAALQIDSEYMEIDPRFGYRAATETIISKKGASAFWGTNLISVLVPQRVDTLIIAGCTTSGCVRATAVDACQYGFRVIVPQETVADRAREPHEAALFDINAKYGDVMTVDHVLSWLIKL